MTRPIPETGDAPADLHPRPPRSLAVTVLAYLLLAALAVASIWYIDRGVIDDPREDQAPATSKR